MISPIIMRLTKYKEYLYKGKTKERITQITGFYAHVITAKMPDRSGLIYVCSKQQGQKLTLITTLNTLTKQDVELIRHCHLEIKLKMKHQCNEIAHDGPLRVAN